jgi:tetratricopeptide (TPR) repeat protein
LTPPRDRRSLQRAAARQPDDPMIHERLARALLAAQDLEGLGRLQPALDCRFADRAFTHLVAGHAAKAVGDREGAAARYRRTLALAPGSGEALYNLVDLGAIERHDAEGRLLAENARRSDLPAADRVNLRFALARLEERDGASGPALSNYREANELARATLAAQGIRHDEASAEHSLQAALANWQPHCFTAPLATPALDLTPVFVTGLPRSGTTLVEQILASHPEVAAGGELTAGPAAEHDFRRRLGLAPTDALPPPTDSSLRAALERAREQYLDGLFERGLDARWVVDKLPANARIAGFLRLLFPAAPIVHCSREPRALAWSLYTANFAAHEPWVHDLSAMAGVFRRHRRLVAHWRKVLPAPCADVVYEDLVRAPERTIRALLAACGIPFDPATLRPEQLDRPIFTASHDQVRRPIHRDAVDRWRPYGEALAAFSTVA